LFEQISTISTKILAWQSLVILKNLTEAKKVGLDRLRNLDLDWSQLLRPPGLHGSLTVKGLCSSR